MSEVRSRLRARQSELLGALVAGRPVPEGFDPVLVELTASGLARKRAHETGYALRRRVPTELFEQFAAEVPRAATPRLDAYRYCGWRLRRGQDVRAAVAFRLGLRETRGDALPCRWPRLHLSRAGLALYWPGRGVRWVT